MKSTRFRLSNNYRAGKQQTMEPLM